MLLPKMPKLRTVRHKSADEALVIRIPRTPGIFRAKHPKSDRCEVVPVNEQTPMIGVDEQHVHAVPLVTYERGVVAEHDFGGVSVEEAGWFETGPVPHDPMWMVTPLHKLRSAGDRPSVVLVSTGPRSELP